NARRRRPAVSAVGCCTATHRETPKGELCSEPSPRGWEQNLHSTRPQDASPLSRRSRSPATQRSVKNRERLVENRVYAEIGASIITLYGSKMPVQAPRVARAGDVPRPTSRRPSGVPGGRKERAGEVERRRYGSSSDELSLSAESRRPAATRCRA